MTRRPRTRYIGGRPPTLDELDQGLQKIAVDYPDLRALREICRSRQGRPMTMLTMPGGPEHVLAIGAPHPNERKHLSPQERREAAAYLHQEYESGVPLRNLADRPAVRAFTHRIMRGLRVNRARCPRAAERPAV